MSMSTASAAERWDDRVSRALERAPGGLRRTVAWLREPSRRWVRIPAGILLILGGVFSILPVLGLWMLPLGLALLSEDVPALKDRLEGVASWFEEQWRRIRSRKQIQLNDAREGAATDPSSRAPTRH